MALGYTQPLTEMSTRNISWGQRRLEQIEVRKCLLSFGAESVVFQVAIQKLKYQDI
jgi:hypothetical protein